MSKSKRTLSVVQQEYANLCSRIQDRRFNIELTEKFIEADLKNGRQLLAEMANIQHDQKNHLSPVADTPESPPAEASSGLSLSRLLQKRPRYPLRQRPSLRFRHDVAFFFLG